MGDIGREQREVTFEPLPEEAPIPEPTPSPTTPAPEPEKVPA